MKKLVATDQSLPPIIPSEGHEVHVFWPFEGVIQPYPRTWKDLWDSKHVRMPNSESSLFPKICKESGKKNLVPRWSVVLEAFSKRIDSVDELKRAILSYNPRYVSKWSFRGLKHLIEEEFCEEERNYFFSNILGEIIELALSLPPRVTRAPSLLPKNVNKSISLSQKQVASLLANAFLCTFPRRNARGAHAEFSSYPDINFNRLFSHKEQAAIEKMKCIIQYFKEISSRKLEDDGMLTFTRQSVGASDMPDFELNSTSLRRFFVRSDGLIEEAQGLLQVDFANKYVGGGVLGLGCVQEEIRFVLCPELLVSMLFTEVLGPSEALIITGVEQFNLGRGYASEFHWCSPFRDATERDSYRRKLCQVVAIDAYEFSTHPQRQYKPNFVSREISKAYSGFRVVTGCADSLPAVATGNWGCGAFQGNARLKALIQMAAGTVAGRDLVYYTFGDSKLKEDLVDIHRFLCDSKCTTGQLVMALKHYGAGGRVDGSDLLDYVRRAISHYESDTDSEASPDQMDVVDSKPENCTANDAQPRTSEKKITDYFKVTPTPSNHLGVSTPKRKRNSASEEESLTNSTTD